MKRRHLLKHGLALAATTLVGCSGSEDPVGDLTTPSTTTPPTTSPPPASNAWTPYVPALIVGSSATFDLSTTLPSAVKRGGTFGIEPTGARLPAGMSLTSAGLLSVGTAAISTVAGVIFTYDAP